MIHKEGGPNDGACDEFPRADEASGGWSPAWVNVPTPKTWGAFPRIEALELGPDPRTNVLTVKFQTAEPLEPVGYQHEFTEAIGRALQEVFGLDRLVIERLTVARDEG